jgi:hypothetical protein
MRATRLAPALAVLLAAPPAAAQLSNHGIAVESGVSAPLRGARAVAGTIALSATTWLTGELEGVARVARASVPGTAGRAAATGWIGALGLRLSLGDRTVRPQVLADVGWASAGGEGGPSPRLAVRVGAGVEAFLARDLSISARAALRVTGGAAAGEGILALAAYF